MSFSHKNPVTNKVWNREQLFEALQLEQAKNKKSTSDLITWEAQAKNVLHRWDNHDEAFNNFVQEIVDAGRFSRKVFDSILA